MLTYWERAGQAASEAKGVVSVLNCYNIKGMCYELYKEQKWRGLELVGADRDKVSALQKIKERAKQIKDQVRSEQLQDWWNPSNARSVVVFAQTDQEFREWRQKLTNAFHATHATNRTDKYTPQQATAVKSVIEGWMMMRDLVNGLPSDTWSKLYVKLFDTRMEAFAKPSSTEPRYTFRLTREFYVGDSRQRANAFIVSDFDETYNFATESGPEKMFWMQTIAKLLRTLAGESWAAETLAGSGVGANTKANSNGKTNAVHRQNKKDAPPPPPSQQHYAKETAPPKAPVPQWDASHSLQMRKRPEHPTSTTSSTNRAQNAYLKESVGSKAKTKAACRPSAAINGGARHIQPSTSLTAVSKVEEKIQRDPNAGKDRRGCETRPRCKE